MTLQGSGEPGQLGHIPLERVEGDGQRRPTGLLLSECDISDRVAITLGSPGGGGFTGEQFFVEGVHEIYRPAGPVLDDVTLTLDLSPVDYYRDNPFRLRYEPGLREADPARARPRRGGADPIPGMTCTAERRLRRRYSRRPYAYWRLGETGEPWADTSGTGPEPADLTLEGYVLTPAITPDVTGGAPRRAGRRRGRAQLRQPGVYGGDGPYLYYSGSKEFDMAPDGQMSVCAWVKPKASATNRRGVIIGNSNISAGHLKIGWGLHMFYPERYVYFTRGQATAARSSWLARALLYRQATGTSSPVLTTRRRSACT